MVKTAPGRVKIEVHDLNIWFGSIHAKAGEYGGEFNEILSVIGPANSGKTTFAYAKPFE